MIESFFCYTSMKWKLLVLFSSCVHLNVLWDALWYSLEKGLFLKTTLGCSEKCNICNMFPLSLYSYNLQQMYFPFSFSICKNVSCYNKGHLCVLKSVIIVFYFLCLCVYNKHLKYKSSKVITAFRLACDE